MSAEKSGITGQLLAPVEHPVSFLHWKIRAAWFLLWQKSRFARDFLWETYRGTFFADNVPLLAAAISFYTVLSILPLALVFVAISGYVLKSSEQALFEATNFLVKIFPATTTSVFTILLDLIRKKTIFGVVGLVGLAWTASRIFGVTEAAMNAVWQAPSGRTWWRSKLLSVILIPLAFIFLVFSVTVTSLYRLAQHRQLPLVGHRISEFPTLGKIVTLLLPIFLGFLAFWVAYRFLPNRKVPWRAAALGALVASLVWEACKYGFDLYIKRFADYNRVYGTYATLVITVLWIYFSAYILLVGAEIGVHFENVRQRFRIFAFFRKAFGQGFS